jgi:hypothetical protein
VEREKLGGMGVMIPRYQCIQANRLKREINLISLS